MNHFAIQEKSAIAKISLLANEFNAIQAKENALEVEYKNLQIEQIKIDKTKQAIKSDRDRLQNQRLEILSRLQEFNNELLPVAFVQKPELTDN